MSSTSPDTIIDFDEFERLVNEKLQQPLKLTTE